MKNINKILIIRLSSLGDLLLTTPLVRSIKKANSNTTIDFIVRKEFEDTIKFNPNIRNIISLSRNYNPKEIRAEIKSNNYDLIVDLQNNLRSRIITKGLKNKIVRYKKPIINRLLLVKFKINRFDKILTIPERYALSVEDVELDNFGLELVLPVNINSRLTDDRNYVGICPGSKHKTKMWPEEYFVALGKKLSKKYTVCIFGGKDDKAVCQRVSKEIDDSIDLSNDNKLLQLAADMKKCKAIICNDSGLMHTALSVDVPVVAIFGSTVKELGFFPYKGRNLVLENNLLSCRPCSHIGLSECPKGHFKCMKDLTPEIVFNKTITFIENL